MQFKKVFNQKVFNTFITSVLSVCISLFEFDGTAANMQRHSSKESEIKIPPNLLKNFNVYDILEPEKNGAKSSDATKVDKLVDIDDCSQDSGFQDSDFNPAFLDKNRDFDLVDLYQNIFVTPQHIKKKEATELDAPFSASEVIDPGFKQFFDMLESGEKIDWTNITQTEEETIIKHDFIEKKPKVLVPKVFTESDSDPEDVINEVLMQKKWENIVLGKMISNSFKGYSSESRERESPKKIEKSDVISEFSRLSLNNVTEDSKFESGSNENVPPPFEVEPCPVDSQINNSLPNFTVRAIQKDEKVYKKKRLVKSEIHTANYTRGPDFYEKSVVLPQIMARLNARLAYLDEESNQKKRLILDAGAKPKAECNSSNANVQVRRKPTNQTSGNTSNVNAPVKTKSNNQPESVLSTKKAPNNASSSGIHSLKLNNVQIKEDARLYINKMTKDVRVDTTDKPCLNCANPSTAKMANSPVAGSVKTNYGKLSPVVLMKDCNKERLRALKQSQMFKDFVLKGKYDL